MSTRNGTAQKFLLSAFRYFGLTTDKGVSTPDLQRLVKAEGAERRALWRKIFVRAYPEFFNAKINLETATFEELAEIFSNEVSSQDTIRKCVTFFLHAAKDAGIKTSPHVKPYAGTRPSTRQARNHAREGQRQRSRAQPQKDSKRGNDSPYLKLLLEKFPNFDPNWSAEVRNNWLSGMQEAIVIAGDGKATGVDTVREPPDEDPDDQRQLTLW